MRKLDGGRTWADIVGMARGNAEPLALIGGLFIMLPALIVQVFVPFVPVATTLQARVNEQLAYFEANMGPLLVALIVSTFGQAVILSLLLDPDRPTIGRSFGIGAAGLIWLLIANFLTAVVVGTGLTLFIVPGLYLFGRLAPVPAILFAERRTSPIQLFSRSFAMTRGNGWRNLLLFAVIWVTATIVIAAAISVVGIVASLAAGSLAIFITALVAAMLDTAFALLLLLTYAAIYRQLA